MGLTRFCKEHHTRGAFIKSMNSKKDLAPSAFFPHEVVSQEHETPREYFLCDRDLESKANRLVCLRRAHRPNLLEFQFASLAFYT